jgi:hypothetical protein
MSAFRAAVTREITRRGVQTPETKAVARRLCSFHEETRINEYHP